MENISLKSVAEILANHTQIDELVDLAEAFKKGEIAIEGLDVNEVRYPNFPMTSSYANGALSKLQDSARLLDPMMVTSLTNLWKRLADDNRSLLGSDALRAALSVMLRRPAVPQDIHILMEREVITPEELLWISDHWPFDDRKPLEAALATALDIALNGSEQ